MDINPDDLSSQERYKLLIGGVVPRPIAFVSTQSPDGKHNVAPYSYFAAVCFNPMILAFFPIRYKNPGEPKDSFKNIEATGEFVINVSTKSIVSQINQSSAKYEYGVSEFEKTGLTPRKSVVVKPPSVAESPINFECKVEKIVRLGEDQGGADAVFGRVVHIRVEDDLIDNFRIDIEKLQPVARLAGNWYAELGNLFEIPRPE